jgi:hypothetical protein
VVGNSAEAGGDEQPVRLHLEKTAAGEVSVWLGVDGDPATAAARAASVLLELRRQLAPGGQRIQQVVCNGSVIHRPPRAAEEFP